MRSEHIAAIWIPFSAEDKEDAYQFLRLYTRFFAKMNPHIVIDFTEYIERPNFYANGDSSLGAKIFYREKNG